MAKDLRGFLEPPRDSGKSKETQSSVPLAHRRGLVSPGEPRVFQVRSGFVCGLCGLVHKNLERAFDCLGRCTVQLRLRSPAGPSHFGSQAHFACTACGRGYANCDDAEQCFERCIHKLKPTREFENALRRVQVRYAQRLASHGVRQLERIDPFKEHTKMLEVLTKEQEALKNPAQPQVVPENHLSTSVEDDGRDFQQSARIRSGIENPTTSLSSSETQSTHLTEVLQENETQNTQAIESISQFAANEPQLTAEESQLTAEESQLTAEEPQLGDEEPQLGDEELNSTETPDPTSALEMLTEEAAQLDVPDIQAQMPSKIPMPKISQETATQFAGADSVSSLEMDDFILPEASKNLPSGLALSGSSEFEDFGLEKETEAGLGDDVMSMLQDSYPSIESSTKKGWRSSSGKDKSKVNVDFLDEVLGAEEDQSDYNTVFVRKEKMKPYKREYSKYCCSACSKEFFTKEQVEACFFSHPEEGSEEERVLLEKVAKLKNKSAA
ncbi:MAG: hypothetical protein RJB13_1937 [Pseudomonadota bacterium]